MHARTHFHFFCQASNFTVEVLVYPVGEIRKIIYNHDILELHHFVNQTMDPTKSFAQLGCVELISTIFNVFNYNKYCSCYN